MVKFAGNQTRAGVGAMRWGKKLEVAPRSSDLSPWWRNNEER